MRELSFDETIREEWALLLAIHTPKALPCTLRTALLSRLEGKLFAPCSQTVSFQADLPLRKTLVEFFLVLSLMRAEQSMLLKMHTSPGAINLIYGVQHKT